MERSSSLRPPRPSRDVPPPPIDTRSAPPSAASSEGSPQSDGAFATPLVTPTRTQTTETVSEIPPPLPPKGKETAQDEPSSVGGGENASALTPLRAHYLKKQLVQLQFHHELSALTNAPTNNISAFSYLGPPFTPPPKDVKPLDLPFLRYMFRQFVLSFPFLAAAPKDFFPEKLQPFLASLFSRNLSGASVLDTDPENSEEAARFRLLGKLERNFSMLITSGTRLTEREEVVRLTQTDLNRLEALAKRRAARERKLGNMFEVNVICVRTVIEKGRMRSKVHEEFIVRTRRAGQPDIFVSRRYGDFKTLSDELRKAHPDESVPQPPAKDRTIVNVTVTSPSSPTANLFVPFQSSAPGMSPTLSAASSSTAASTSTLLSRTSTSNISRTSTSTPTRQHRQYGMPGSLDLDRVPSNLSVESGQSISSSPGSLSSGGGGSASSYGGGMQQQASRLTREKNRLTLRSYLHSLLAIPTLASSLVLKSFLLSGPTRLSEEELEDARRREEADRLREDGRKRFAREIRDRVEGLRDAVRGVKGELLGKDGLTQVFATIKHTPDVRNLPPNYQAVIEWARISLASTVFQHFVAADNASESFAGLKRIHGLMPYFMLKAALKISNPVAMIRGVLDLFLAQPFGGRSLLQRMFTGSLLEEVKALEEDIEAVKEKVEDPVLCEKVRLFVYAPREIQAVYKADAAADNVHILTVVLRSGDAPALSRAQMHRVVRAHRAHKEYMKYVESLADSDDDDGPQDEDAWLYEDLTVLAKLYSRLKDREQLIALIFEGTTAELLKDIITIFYAPLGQVYRAASIADSLGDLQNFVNDLIRTVEQTEELSQEDPARTVQIFIDLIQRHEQSFYTFVHKVHSKGEGLFDSLMRWIERFLTLMREGLGSPVSLEFLLPHTGAERKEILREVDEVARYHYKLKVAYEDRLRRRFGRTQGLKGADAEDEAAAQLVDGVVADLSFGELVKGDADELAAAEEDEDREDDDSSSEGTGSGGSTSSGDEESSSGESGSEESESESESGESGGGSSTEGDVAPSRQTTPIARSRTVGHSPSPHSPPPQQQQFSRPKQSLDLPTGSLRQPVPRLRNSRSMTLTSPLGLRSRSPPPPLPNGRSPVPVSPTSKALPPSPLPPRSHRRARSATGSRTERASSPTKKKPKRHEGPKPPELEHIPKLLPLFVEMMRPLLTPRSTAQR